jgi:metal-sulfur cluster biosynthetic enzyme
MKLTKKLVMNHLRTVMDPELHVNIVDLGLIYDVSVAPVQTATGKRTRVHVLLTLTTPGCPLGGMFDRMIKDSLKGIDGLNPETDVTLELTFDPPWIVDMIAPETRAELNL